MAEYVETDAGRAAVGTGPWNVDYTHEHPTLAKFDQVVVREVGPPGSPIVLVRTSDHTIHSLTGQFGQFVHLSQYGDNHG